MPSVVHPHNVVTTKSLGKNRTLNFFLENFNDSPVTKELTQFHTNVLFLYPMEILETQRLFDIFRGCRNGTLTLSAWGLLKGHTYLNIPAAFSCKFA